MCVQCCFSFYLTQVAEGSILGHGAVFLFPALADTWQWPVWRCRVRLVSCPLPAVVNSTLWSAVGELTDHGEFDFGECGWWVVPYRPGPVWYCGVLLVSCPLPARASLILWSVVGELSLTGQGQFDTVECCWWAASHRPWPVWRCGMLLASCSVRHLPLRPILDQISYATKKCPSGTQRVSFVFKVVLIVARKCVRSILNEDWTEGDHIVFIIFRWECLEDQASSTLLPRSCGSCSDFTTWPDTFTVDTCLFVFDFLFCCTFRPCSYLCNVHVWLSLVPRPVHSLLDPFTSLPTSAVRPSS